MNVDVAVRDVMSHEFVGVSESDDVRGTVKLMLDEGVDCAVVLRGQEPVGVFTERDVMSLVAEGADSESATVGDLMGDSGPTVSPDAGVDRALDLMATADVRRLLVGESDLLGVLTEHDLLSAAALERYQEPEDPRGVATNGADEYATSATATADTAVSEQSICQDCGALTRGLVEVDGQLLCPDCRDV
jgi:CBS domain-containing protein